MKKIGIVGCGLMGRGVAEVSARAGFETVVREVSQDFLDKGTEAIRGSLERQLHKERISQEDFDGTLERVHGTTSLSDMADCDLVIEAIIENRDLKAELFTELDGIVKPEGLFASNTSSLTLTQLAAGSGRPDRFVGIHFFNPVPAMKLVEVIRTLMTSDEAFGGAWSFVEALQKTPIACKDNSGFIVNRLLVPYLLDAIRAYENGIGTLEDIDTGMKLGCGHPMGPFTLLDFIGLDTIYFIADIMFEEYRETRFAPPPLLKQMVEAGRLGRKSGRGFYDYQAS